MTNQAANHFQLKGKVIEIRPFGKGHINRTFQIVTSSEKYILQALNTEVFKDPEAVFFNTDLLQSYLKENYPNSSLLVPTVTTKTGKNYLLDETGAWRAFPFFQHVASVERITDRWQAKVAAEGFAKFNQVFKNLDSSHLKTTIPHFHILNQRLAQLDEAVQKDPFNRLKKADKLTDKVNEFRWLNDHMNQLWKAGLPKRVCHNDTKINNVLLDMDSKTYRHVIDLDTVMEGTWLYDFGDMMRTFLSPTDESEQKYSLIHVRMELFREVLQAYLNELYQGMAPLEKENLVFGGKYMCYLMAVRFLTDYLLGDVYYRTSFTNENYIRARNQLVLLEEIGKMEPQMNSWVKAFRIDR